ncbi:MAG: PAS domain S-box protein, partial [Planctomycetota bacterium]
MNGHPMVHRDLLQSVEHAREQLRGLVARHAGLAAAGAGAPEIRDALGELVERLERLQTHYAMLLAIVARGADALYAKDRDGRYLLMNPSGAALFGVSVESIIGRDDTALFDAAGAARVMELDREVMRTGKPYSGEATYVVRGVATTLSTTLTIWNEPSGELRGLIGVTRDLTEHRKVEAAAAHERGRLRSL